MVDGADRVDDGWWVVEDGGGVDGWIVDGECIVGVVDCWISGSVD